MQDGREDNLKCLAWKFYFYGTEIHKLGQSTLTHGERVEQKVMTAMNVWIAVVKRKSNRGTLVAMVLYCDQSIKGYGAPNDAPWKAKLICDLVLCPECEARQSIIFEMQDSGRPGGE
jgi:hypothetical protein